MISTGVNEMKVTKKVQATKCKECSQHEDGFGHSGLKPFKVSDKSKTHCNADASHRKPKLSLPTVSVPKPKPEAKFCEPLIGKL